MAPAATSTPSDRDRVGPHPSYIEVAKPYILQSSINRCLSELGMVEAKEDLLRLQGITYIDNVRRALQLPVRTFNTAAVYYHKFRLLHADSEYNWADASAAALFTACKIEDTLKKSREILCANWNLGKTSAEHLSPDDPRFENHSKLILGLERLMLESAGFDFRNRYPQKLVVKLAKAVGFEKGKEGHTVWNLSMDLYRTWAVLKQSTTTMAVACVELAARLHGKAGEEYVDKGALDYKKWNTSRAEVMGMFWIVTVGLWTMLMRHRDCTGLTGPLHTPPHLDIRRPRLHSRNFY
jgi:CTD kinase subunit beta